MARGTGNVAPRGGGKGKDKGKGRASNTSDANRAQAAQRVQRRQQQQHSSSGPAAGPSSILGVYDYVAENGGGEQGGGAGKKRKRVDRAVRRATAGFEDAAGAGAGASSAQRKRRRHGEDEDGADDDEDEEDDEDEDLSDSERVRAPAIFSDGEEDGPQAFEGEDEELDSDEAFGESDEERYEGWAFSGSKSKRDDDDDEDEEDDDEEGMDLDQVLNAVSDEEEAEDDEDDEEAGVKGLDELVASASAQAQSKPSASGPADFYNFDAPEMDTGSGPVTLEDLLAPLTQDASLGSAELRKRVSALAAENRGKTKAGKEGAGAIDGKTGALAAPLPAILQDRVDRAAAYEATRAQVEGWQPTLKRLREAEHLSFPLQKPAEIKSSNASLVASMLSTKHGSAARSALETQTADLLRAAEMTDSQITKREDLAMNKLDPAVVEERRRELARMRELMFRAEQKAKRVSKIKSKSYRRIARKEKEKLKQKMAEAGLTLDGDDDGELDYEAEQADRIKAERERARERATLKHKNTGQWAKTMAGRRGRDAETVAALEEQLQRGQKLRQKIQDEDSQDEDDDSYDSGSEGDGEDGEGGVGQIRARAFDELASFEEAEAARAQADEDAIEAAAAGRGGESGVGKGLAKVMQMKFMRDARARADQGVREAADELRAELARAEREEAEAEEAGSDGDGSGAEAAALRGRVALVGGNAGRAVFAAGKDAAPVPSASKGKGKGKGKGKADAEGASASDKAIGSLSSGISVTHSAPASSKISKTKASEASASDEDVAPASSSVASNPWLAGASSSSGAKLSKKRNEVVVGRNSDALAKAANRVERHASKADAARRAAAEDARVEIEDAAAGLGGRKEAVSAPQLDADADSDSDGDEDGADGVVAVPRKSQGKQAASGGGSGMGRGIAFTQRDLVAEAFAGDDVAAQFAEEKRALVEADAPKEEDNSLPGWGSWSGKGVKHSAAQKARLEANRKKHTKTLPGLDPSKRKDAGLEHVIINERADKKLERYKVKDLPHPYTSAAQYDLVMRNAVGPEWNTRTQHQRMTLPRVVTKPGKAIQPIERKF
ncbi:hypothetical protein OC834_006583 [Tilletia horrida]|nr:hypothetical protein OC834_006583 [Tilletia horrida]